MESQPQNPEFRNNPCFCLIFFFFFFFFFFVALCPMSTAMVIAGRSVHLTTLFSWAGLSKQLTSNLCTYSRL